ncbi:MAG TPA: DUF1761 domain-containing protein [Candidatus Paceibacterota bacterium]|nr:DUF1761 domain-containing protein [Candidatus Paceibacterota bacterium]
MPINYLAVLVCGIAAMILGYLWYGPFFGKTWMREMGVSVETMSPEQTKGMGKRYFLMFIGALVMAWVLAHSIITAALYTGLTGVGLGLLIGFMSWLGFVAPVTLGSVLWENKSWKLWWINNSYYIVDLVIMGIILALWV